jgi:hypothetical protein
VCIYTAALPLWRHCRFGGIAALGGIAAVMNFADAMFSRCRLGFKPQHASNDSF